MKSCAVLIAGLVAGIPAPPAHAGAQSGAVLLKLRPRAGDTLRLRLDQTVEMSGAVNGAGDSLSIESSTLVVLSRLIIESADSIGATVLALTDSVRVASPPHSATGSLLDWARALQGQRLRFRVATDGSTTFAGKRAAGGATVGGMLAEMPATLPAHPVVPGATWTRTVAIPLLGTPDPSGAATLTAIFQFDSLSRSGELAFLSLRGRLTRGPTESKGDKGRVAEVVQTSGTVIGHVLVDRRRGWITDARTTISLRSLVTPADRNKPPMRVRVTISQWMRAM